MSHYPNKPTEEQGFQITGDAVEADRVFVNEAEVEEAVANEKGNCDE